MTARNHVTDLLSPSLSNLQLAALVWASHGLLDGGLTAYAVVATGGTAFEANKLLVWLTDSLYELLVPSASGLPPGLELAGFATVLLVLKVAVAGVAAGLLYAGREAIPAWRQFAWFLALTAVAITGLNLLSL